MFVYSRWISVRVRSMTNNRVDVSSRHSSNIDIHTVSSSVLLRAPKVDHARSPLHTRNTAWQIRSETNRSRTVINGENAAKQRRYQVSKVFAVAIVPFIILLPLTGFFVIDAISLTRTETQLRDIVQGQLSPTRIAVNHLQKERFFSALYLFSPLHVNVSTLSGFYLATDKLWEEYGFFEMGSLAEHGHSLTTLRQSVLSREISAYQCYEHYNVIIESLTVDLLYSIKSVTDARLSQAFAAYHCFARFEEQFQIITLIGTLLLLMTDNYNRDVHIEKLSEGIRGIAYLETSMRYSDQLAEDYDQWVATHRDIYDTYELLKGGLIFNRPTISPEERIKSLNVWLNVSTEFANGLDGILLHMERPLLQQIDDDISSFQSATAVYTIFFSFLLILTPIVLYLVVSRTLKLIDLSSHLKAKVLDLEVEKIRSDSLLYQMLPREIADQLKYSGGVSAETFDSVTIYFSEVVNFAKICSESNPIQVVTMLNTLYQTLDSKVDEYDAYKVETINDAYMLASGLPQRNGDRHVYEICSLAVDLRDLGESLPIPHRKNETFKLKVGINTGPCAAGIVGSILPRYCLFGDTINTASRMESTGQGSKIHLSADTYDAVRPYINDFNIEYRGVVCVKGKGEMDTYWLLGKGRGTGTNDIT